MDTSTARGGTSLFQYMRGSYQHDEDPEGIQLVPTGAWTTRKREALNPSTMLDLCTRYLKQSAIYVVASC